MIKTAYRFGRDTIFSVYALSKNSVGAIKKATFKNSVYAYWWNKKKNFGDLITPHLFQHYGMFPIHKSINDAEVISTGSILQRADENQFSGIILGSGIIKDEEKKFPHATILAVRGRKTAERIGAPSDVALADPGILISELINDSKKKEFELGIVPHFQDKDDKNVISFKKGNRDKVLIIDVQNSPEYVANEIARCENIMSSSLHGLITADSLGIPNVRFKTSETASGGGDFKFEDYNSSICRDNICHKLDGKENTRDIIQIADIKIDEIQNCKKTMMQAMLKMKYQLNIETI